MGSLLRWVAREYQGCLPTPNPTWGVRRVWAGALVASGLSLIELQVESKATLGLGGVAVVLGAVVASMGFYSYVGVPSSLVILQVVPFLVLAVGADNIFILVLEYQVRREGLFIPNILFRQSSAQSRWDSCRHVGNSPGCHKFIHIIEPS